LLYIVSSMRDNREFISPVVNDLPINNKEFLY